MKKQEKSIITITTHDSQTTHGKTQNFSNKISVFCYFYSLIFLTTFLTTKNEFKTIKTLRKFGTICT